MAIFDKLENLAKTAGEKTGNAIELTKLNARIGIEREHINKAKLAIGDIYYSKLDEGYELLPEAECYVEQIKMSLAAIADAQDEIARIKSGDAETRCAYDEPAGTVKFCPACGSKCDALNIFCPACGNKF